MSVPRFQMVPGGRMARDATIGGVGWRLLGSNNRELGRSPQPYPDAESAIAAIEQVRLDAPHALSAVRHDPRTGLWWWQLTKGSAPIATSGRGFRHERECRYNLDQFRETAPVASAQDRSVPHQASWEAAVDLRTDAVS